MAGSSYIVILIKSWKGLELVSQFPALNQKQVSQSPALNQKQVSQSPALNQKQMFLIQHTLIVLRIQMR